MPSLEQSKVLLSKTKILLHYVFDFGWKKGRAIFLNVVV